MVVLAFRVRGILACTMHCHSHSAPVACACISAKANLHCLCLAFARVVLHHVNRLQTGPQLLTHIFWQQRTIMLCILAPRSWLPDMFN